MNNHLEMNYAPGGRGSPIAVVDLPANFMDNHEIQFVWMNRMSDFGIRHLVAYDLFATAERLDEYLSAINGDDRDVINDMRNRVIFMTTGTSPTVFNRESWFVSPGVAVTMEEWFHRFGIMANQGAMDVMIEFMEEPAQEFDTLTDAEFLELDVAGIVHYFENFDEQSFNDGGMDDDFIFNE